MSPNWPGVDLITFEDYLALDLQQRLTLNRYEYNVNMLKYEYDRRDIEQELKRMEEDPSKIDEDMSQSISKIHVIQSTSRCYFAAGLANLFLFAAPFEEHLSGSLTSMTVYLFEEKLINQTVQENIFGSSQVSSKFVVFSEILARNCTLIFLEHHQSAQHS